MSVRLDDLDYFIAVADCGQVRRAASALGVSQPALTKGIQRLERELGFALFDRTPRGMVLTPVARDFLQRTNGLRGALHEAIQHARNQHLGHVGLLKVGVLPIYVDPLLATAVLQLRRQRPAVRVQLKVEANDALVDALAEGQIDLAFAALPESLPNTLAFEPLFNDDIGVVVRDGHPLLARIFHELRVGSLVPRRVVIGISPPMPTEDCRCQSVRTTSWNLGGSAGESSRLISAAVI